MKLRTRVPVENIGWLEYDSGGPEVRLGDRIFPVDVAVVFPSDEESPSLRMRLAVVDDVPQCREVVIEAKDGGREIRTSDLRALPLEQWVETLFALVALRVTNETDGVVTAVAESSPARAREAAKVVEQARVSVRKTITHDLLVRVAEVYRSHIDDRPTQAVARHFGVQHRTAAKYVQRAREAELLPPTTPGKRKA